MRIAIVSRYARKGDGQGTANREITLVALRHGHDVTLFADKVDPDVIDAGAKWVPISPSIRSNDLAYGLQSVAASSRALKGRRNDFDVIHGYGWTLNGPHHINTAQFVHSAWMHHSMHPGRVTKGPYGLYQRMYTYINANGERAAFRASKRVIAASTLIQSELQSYAHVAPNRINVVLNGANLKEFYPGHESRLELKLPESVFLALFAGDIRTGRKNLDGILKAIKQIPNMHLAVAGRTAGSPWPRLAMELGIGDRVHFLGFRSDIARLMRAADCFVFPSRYEACALVIVEALASGLPVVTARTTGGAEAVSEDAGIIIEDTESTEALVSALSSMMGSKARLTDMGIAARRVALALDWNSIGELYLQHYQDVAGHL